MVKVRFTLYFLFTMAFTGLGQNQGGFNMEFSYSKQQMPMAQANEYLLDSNRYAPEFIDSNITTTINSGNRFTYGLAYQALNAWDFGVRGDFQIGETQHQEIYTVDAHKYVYEHEYRVYSMSCGIGSNFYANKYFKWDQKSSFLNRLVLAGELSSGVSVSYMEQGFTVSEFRDILYYSKSWKLGSVDFNGNVGIKVGLRLSNSPIFTSLGLRAGYQYLVTRDIRNDAGNIIPNWGEGLSLDFSGMYFGTYFTIGK